ncbi:MAG: MarR family winged helix-turn-helix transcriptional regulator [Angustibacter sp.]
MHPVEELSLLVKAAAREGDRQVNAALRPLGLTVAQAEVLVILLSAEPLSLRDLGELLVAESGHPSRLVDRMVAAGWVERATALDDRRRRHLRLTASGRRLATRAVARQQELQGRTRGLIRDQDVAVLRDVLVTYLGDGPWTGSVRRRRQL